MSVIDSLVIELGLDATGMSKGQKQAMEDLRKFERAAEHTGEDVQASGKKASDFFSSVRREALGMFAVFTAGRSLKAFIGDTTKANAQLGYMSHNLSIPAQNLYRMETAAQAAGGAFGEVAQTYAAMQEKLGDPRQRADIATIFAKMHVDNWQDSRTHNMRTDIVERLNRAIHENHMNAGVAAGYMRSLGLSQGMINEALMGPSDLRRLHANTNAIPTPTPQQLHASQQLYQDWVTLQKQSESLGNSLTSNLAPGLDQTLQWMLKWERENPNLAGGIGLAAGAVRDLNGALGGFGGIMTGLLAMKGIKGLLGLFAREAGGSSVISEIADWARPKVGSAAAVAESAVETAAPKAATNWGLAGFSAVGKALPFLSTALAARDIFGEIGDGKRRVSEAYETSHHMKERQQKALAFFQSQGFSRSAALGILGNLQQESGLDASRVGDSGAAFGLAQWHKDRADDIQKRFGIDVRKASFDDQLRAVALEMASGGDSGARKAGATLRLPGMDVSTATSNFRSLYERPANLNGNEDQMRFALASKADRSNPAPANSTTVNVGDIHIDGAKEPHAVAQEVHRTLLSYHNTTGVM